MIRHAQLVAAAWALTVVVIAGTALAWSTAVPIVEPERATRSPRGAIDVTVTAIDTNRLASSASMFRDHDPFRLDRKPAAIRFNPTGPVNQQGTPPPPAPPRPNLRLVGIIGRAPWTTIVEGIPGREAGALMRIGDDLGGIRLTAVGGDSAVLTGFDTTWVLRVRAPWH